MKTGKNLFGLIIAGWAVVLGGPARAGGRFMAPPAAALGRGAAVPAVIGAAPAFWEGLSLGAGGRVAALRGPAHALPVLPAAALLPLARAGALRVVVAPAQADAYKGMPAVLGSVARLADGTHGSADDARLSLGVHFDQGASRAGEASVEAGGASADLAAAPLVHNHYPRVVFLQDVFLEPASQRTVDYLEKLVEAGVHLVFLTSRPLKGPGSAEEILLGRMKARRGNPIVVVSYNGACITLHGRAANPKPIIADITAFQPQDVDVLKGLNAKVAKALGLPAGARLSERALDDGKNVLSFQVKLPAGIPRADVPALAAKMRRAYNRLLQAAGLPYRMEALPDNPRAAVAHSMPLRFSLPRVMEALKEQFQGENLADQPEKFLILADSQRSPKFSTAFPKAAEVQVVGAGEKVEEVLGAVLGDRQLPAVSVKLGQLRQFVEYWEPSRRYAQDAESSGGGAPASRGAADRQAHQKFSMFTGTVIYQLMAWFYEQVWRGQHQFTSQAALQARLNAMWKDPLKYGVYVNKGLARVLQSKSKSLDGMKRGYREYAISYLGNFYRREFGDYVSAARNVQNNLVSLATDRKSLITLDFVSPSTKRAYKIHTRIPRVMAMDTAEGHVLIAYAYRTGKEIPGEGEEFLARILAAALLKGHARKGPDGKWHHGSPEGPIISKLKVRLEYRSSQRPYVFNPEEFLAIRDGEEVSGPLSQEITSAIERMEADPEYLRYYTEHEEEAAKESPDKKQATAGAKAAKPPKSASSRRGK